MFGIEPITKPINTINADDFVKEKLLISLFLQHYTSIEESKNFSDWPIKSKMQYEKILDEMIGSFNRHHN